MAKRNKAKFASKSRKSALRIEALEQRQLLATVIGGGVEVASNISLNGNVFDQVLMTGASVTVQADPGQVVRVSFLDPDGDIVQSEFAGSGKFTVSLEDLKLAGQTGYLNANPAQTFPSDVTGGDGTKYTKGATINYAQGLASIYVDNPEFDTNVSIFSAGLLTNPGFFSGQAKQGGNHFANVARLIIVGDPTNEAAYNNFGGIRAANAIFGASSGVVGIRAENIAVQNTVIIGDIDASGSGLPTLVFHPLSQFDELKVAGGDLVQTNGAAFNTSTGGLVAFDRFLSIDGATSAFNTAATKQANIDSGAFLLRSAISQDVLNRAATNQMVQMDGDWNYNLATGVATQSLSGQTYTFKFGGSGQEQLDDMFAQRLFTGNLTVNGALAPNAEINLAGVNGTLSMVGDVSGRIEANGLFAKIGKLDIAGNLLGEVFVQGIDRTVGLGRDVFQNSIGSVNITGSLGSTSASGAYIIAEQIGDVTITGDLSGLISTDVNLGGGFTGTALTGTNYIDYDGAIGNVSVGGNVSSGSVQGMTGIGNINVAGNIVGAGAGAASLAGIFATSAAQNNVATGQSAANLSIGKIGTLTVVGDVDLNATNTLLINIAEEGNFGNVSIQGNGELGRVDNNDFLNVGAIQVGVGFGNANSTTGSVTIADAKSKDPRGTDIDFGGIQVGTAGNATGKIGAVTVTGKGEDTDFNLSGVLGANNLGADIVEVNSLIVTGFEDVVIAGAATIQGSKIGALTLTPIAGVGGTNDDNDGKGTGVATSVTINGNILLDDGVANKGETFAGLNLNLGTTNSTVTVNGLIQTTDFLKGTGSSVGPISLTARSVNFNANVRAETIGAVTLTGGSSALTAAPTLTGLVIGDVTAKGGNSVSLGGTIGSSTLGVGNDRTESVGKIDVSTTGTQAVNFTSTVFSDAIGTTTVKSGDGTATFNALLDARSYQGVTGTYGAISVTSSTRGNVTFNGQLWGTGGDVTLSTGTVGTNSGAITIGTIYQSGAAGKLNATTVGIVGGSQGDITYNADLRAGSINTTTLTTTVNGDVFYGANSTFAGDVGAVVISAADIGVVTYNPVFGIDNNAVFDAVPANQVNPTQRDASAGTVNITTVLGTIAINPIYDDRTSAVGALTASSTGENASISYGARTGGVLTATTGPNFVIGNPGAQIDNGSQIGSLGLLTLTTAGKNAGIAFTSDVEATSTAGIVATTTGTTGAAPVTFTDADIWAQVLGPITVSTQEGGINVDAASSFKGIWDSNSGSVSVADNSFTAAKAGAVVFNGLIEATTYRSAADFTGTMTIGNNTFSGNTAGGGVSFNGQIQTGRFGTESAAGLLDGAFDQGTIGMTTFNGNTSLGSDAQFGIEAGTNQRTFQSVTTQLNVAGNLDQYMPGAKSMGAFTVNGDLTQGGGTATGANGLLRAESLASFTVTGQTTLTSVAANGSAGLIFVPQLGALSFGGAATQLTATATEPVFVGHDIASIAFNSTQTNLNGGTVFLALDATSDLDTIGAITGTGRVVGNTIVSSFNFGVGFAPRGEIEASAIGNVSITATVDGSFVNNAVTDLDIRASNVRGNAPLFDTDTVTLGVQPVDVDPDTAGVQAGTHAITNEAITLDGANVKSFAIGNITITANQIGAFTNTSVFSGLNSFVANGQLGNITVVGNTSGTAQPAMFGAVNDAAWFTVGDGDSIGDDAVSGTDFNGSGLVTGVAEIPSDFTGGFVQVGNVFVNVDNTTHVLPPVEDFDLIGGSTVNPIDGFAVLVGVQLDTAGVDGVGNGLNASLGLGDRIDAQLYGRAGSITFQNGQVANQANVTARATIAAAANTALLGAVVAVAGDGNVLTAEIADLVNDVNPLGVVSMNEAAGTNTAVVGNTLAGAAVLPANQDRWDEGEVLVYVL